MYERRKRYCWRLENLDALVTFRFEGPYEGGARRFLSARARGDSRQEGTYSFTLLYQWLINDDASIVIYHVTKQEKRKGDHRVFPSLKRRIREGGVWYYFCNLDEVVPYIFLCARTLEKIGNDMVWKMGDSSGKIYTSHEFRNLVLIET